MLKKPGIKTPGKMPAAGNKTEDNEVIMSVKGLSYVYPDSDKKAIDDINLDIRRG